MKKIINVGLLLVTYCAMVIACVLLNRENIGADDNVSMIINVTMFVIVGIIFAWAIFSSLMKINKITKELNKVANNISDEYEQEQKYLLEKYCKEGRYNLFENNVKGFSPTNLRYMMRF